MSSKTLTLTHTQRGDTNIIALNAYIAIVSARTACPYLQIKIGFSKNKSKSTKTDGLKGSSRAVQSVIIQVGGVTFRDLITVSRLSCRIPDKP